MNQAVRARMAVAVAALTAVVVVSSPTSAEVVDPDMDPDEPPISADALMANVLRRFPVDPLTIQGEMIVRKRRGVEVARVPFEMSVDWGSEPSRLRCRLIDDDGSVFSELVLELSAGGASRLEVVSGASVSLDSAIAMTDLSWADLGLSFLWWRGGRIVGTDSAKGRDCYLVDVPAPGGTADVSGYSRVRLWIDQSLHVLLRAEGFDESGARVRSLWVRSLKKTDGRWMIKDMEVQRYPAVHRTRLHIDSVTTFQPQACCLGDDGAPLWGAVESPPTGVNITRLQRVAQQCGQVAQRASLEYVGAS